MQKKWLLILFALFVIFGAGIWFFYTFSATEKPFSGDGRLVDFGPNNSSRHQLILTTLTNDVPAKLSFSFEGVPTNRYYLFLALPEINYAKCELLFSDGSQRKDVELAYRLLKDGDIPSAVPFKQISNWRVSFSPNPAFNMSSPTRRCALAASRPEPIELTSQQRYVFEVNVTHVNSADTGPILIALVEGGWK
jgi:hypothetical protein